MPQFIMENKIEAARTESAFVLGFIEAMFFTSCASGIDAADWFDPENQADVAEGRADGCIPGDVGFADLHPDSLASIRDLCETFQNAHSALLVRAYEREGYDEERAGNDYWFTLTGHGVGYWDRDELKAEGLGDQLSEACGRKEINPFFGDHVTHGNAPFVHVYF